MNGETQTNEVVEVVETQEPADLETTKENGEKKYTDADIDAIVNKKYAKWKTDWENEQNEAKKLAKMNAEDKQKYQQDQREKALAEREAEILRKEMTAEAKSMLSERDLPTELVKVVDLTDADSVKQSVQEIQDVWQKAVQKGVEERIKGNAPIEKAQGSVKINPFDNVASRYMKK